MDHSGPPPFFLRWEAHLGAAVDLLGGREDPAAPQALPGCWVDQRHLSGELFFRLSPGRHCLTLPVDGELCLCFRDRSMLAGSLSVLDAAAETRLRRKLVPTTEWQTLRMELPPEVTGGSLCVDVPTGAGWDLATLAVRPLDRTGLRAEQTRRAALPVPANLLPAGRFPLGLPQGWALERSHSPETVLVAEGEPVIGPSGCPALPVTTAREGWLRSPPMLAWGEGEHTASLWLRGKGTLRLAVRLARRELAWTEAMADAAGRRVSLPFAPTDSFTPFSIELSWRGPITIHLDSLRVAPPGATADFGERGRAGIALAPEAAEGLCAEGQRLRVQRWVSGTLTSGDSLAWTLADLYGRRIAGRMPIKDPDASPVSWAVPDEGLAPLGSYRLETWVEDADGEACSGVSELVLHRIPEPRTPWGQENSSSAFGAHLLPTHRHLYVAKRLGVNWVRLHGPGSEICYWYDVEPERGAWRFRPELLARYREAGFSVLGKLTSTPRWASGQAERVHSYFDMFVAPRDLDAWKTYVQETVAHYGADIPVYEVWNEPWLDKFFSRAVARHPAGGMAYPRPENPVAAYATLCRLAAEAVENLVPHPRLIGLNTTTNRDVPGWIDGNAWTRMADEGEALKPVQILSYHDYGSAPDPLRQFALSRESFRFALGPLLDTDRVPKAVWNTEGSAQPEGLSAGLFRRLLPEEPESLHTIWAEAERQARYLLAQRVEGVEKIFLYTMHNFHGLGEDSSFTVLLAPDGSPHPAAASFAVLARAIDGRDVASTEKQPGGWLIDFRNDAQEHTQVFLADGRPHSLPPPHPDVSPWRDLFGNPAADPVRGHTFFRTQRHGEPHDDR